jgi:hypothetical protein
MDPSMQQPTACFSTMDLVDSSIANSAAVVVNPPQRLSFAKAVQPTTNTVNLMDIDSSSNNNIVLPKPWQIT